MTWRKGEKRTSKVRQLASPPVEVIAHRRQSKNVSPLAGSESMSPPARSFSTSASSTGSIRQFPKEVDTAGNIEHKFRLIGIAKERLEHLRTQMKWRVEEGRGEALYRIGVMDNGDALGLNQEELDESLDTLVRVGGPLGFEAVILEKFEGLVAGNHCATVAIRKAWTAPSTKCDSSSVAHEVRVAIVGASEAGKSSIAGYLTRGVVDDGRGKTARSVALHKHEIRIGRTTSFSSHSLPQLETGASRKAVVMRGVENIFCDMDLDHDLGEAQAIPSKIVSLIDSGGHPKALTSCLRGLSACAPDYCLLCIDLLTAAGQNSERLSVALEFLRLAHHAQIPYVVAITKCDSDEHLEVAPSVLEQLGENIVRVTIDQMEGVVANMPQIVPLVYVSAVSGMGMDCLSRLLNLLPCKLSSISELLEVRDSEGDAASDTSSCSKQPSVMGITRTFLLDAEEATEEEDQEEGLFGARELDSASPASLGGDSHQRLIAAGLIQSGSFEVNQVLFVGPSRETGAFSRAKIVSMRCASGSAVTCAVAGTTVSLHLQFLDCDDGATFARRGAFVCDRPSDLESVLARAFDVAIDAADADARDLKKNEEVVAFNGVVSQACRVIDPDVRMGEGRVIAMQFVYRAEYLLRDTVLFKRSDGSVLIGRVQRIQ